MSTRSRTRSAAHVKLTSESSKPKAVPKSRSRIKAQAQPKDETIPAEKENAKGHALKQSGAMGKSKPEPEATYCTCTKGDDGSPMVHCGECQTWYHFTCVDLSEPEAEEINVYICPSCVEKSGRRTAMLWEGPEALDGHDDDSSKPAAKTATKSTSKKGPIVKTEFNADESEESISSEDEYIVESPGPRSKGSAIKHRVRRDSSSSESSHSVSNKRIHRARSKSSTSPTPGVHVKRKNTNASEMPPPKRKKGVESDVINDPTRKYCLSKLEDLFREVYLRYPHIWAEEQQAENIKRVTVSKPLEELTEEEKTALIDESKQFAKELEQSIFEIYSEPDKNGDPHAGKNYKDRFRMLQFNLSKVDRVIIHQRITTANITAKEISLMSSTDLADEETKQSIMIAEQEALEHSILLKTTAPRAKITHKGLQDIESVNGDVVSARELERQREREQEDEERRETERMARLRAVQRQRTTSISVPPESPTVPQGLASEWGAPPPVPAHAMPPMDESPSRPPLFFHTASELATTHEPELNLADLINIDDDSPGQEMVASPQASPPQSSQAEVTPTHPSQPPPSPSTTGISPFATKSERERSMSFDLSTFWNAPKTEPTILPPVPPSKEPIITEHPQTIEEGKDKDVIMAEQVEEANDQDFDMFLDEKDQEISRPVTTEEKQAAFDAIPVVWIGKISMPLDSSIPQETPVVARQMGGRPLEHESLLWKTLFPGNVLRIEGRVPVENSSNFLLQMRMNSARELIAVAFTPSEADGTGFKALSNFLISKGRHGLVFPWGSHPKEHYPGRELYIIPLVSSEPIPEYMELLDDLKLPTERQVDYLVGIWLLNKGKLAPPHPPPDPVTTATTTIPNVPTMPAIAHHPQPPLPQTITPQIPGLPIPSAALAAEFASLTPEQVQDVLRTLQASTSAIGIPPNLPLPLSQHLHPPHASGQPPVPPQVPPPPRLPPLPPLHQPSWPTTPQVQNYYPPTGPHHSPVQPHPPYDRQQYNRDAWPGPGQDRSGRPDSYDRGGRGNDRAWRGGRGRGRGRGGGNNSPSRPSDSGWPRRARNDSLPGADLPRRW